jgi:hypothetical protein
MNSDIGPAPPGTPANIEIFAPFGAAFELMQKILFRPFDLKKWCLIGFAAFLSHLAGGGANFNYNSKLGNWRSSMHTATRDAADSFHNVSVWVVPVVVVLILFVLCVVAVFLWLGARGRFMFTDCIVRNRGAVEEPWREYRHEANSLFLFSIVIAFIFLAIIAIAGIPLFLPLIVHGNDATTGAPFFLGAGFFVLVILLIAIGWGLISQFMVPIMYRRRCSATEAFRLTVSLIGAHLGSFILYLLFMLVLAVAAAMIGCIASCATCCIAAIPYVGTVILLPVYVTLGSYPLVFLRQFGPEYDVWAGTAPITGGEPPVQPPPSEPPPPEPPTPPLSLSS